MTMRILAASCYYPPYHGGGYGLHVSWFCEGLARRGHQVEVLTTARPDGVAEQTEGPLPVERSLNLIGPADAPHRLLTRSRGNVAAVRRAVRRVNPDIIFCGGMDGIGFNTYLAVIGNGRPSLTWLGDTWLGQAWRDLRRYDQWTDLAAGGRRPGFRRTVRRGIGWVGRMMGLACGPRPRTCAPVAALSQFVLEDLRTSGAPLPPATPVIPVSLHPAFFGPTGSPVGHGGVRTPHLRALFVGRMEMLKGPDTAIQAVSAAVALGADVRLTFAGLKIDSLRPQLNELAVSLGVADRITWAGTPELSELVTLYRNHDVFLFPSRIVEGLGVVNCEALACGLPVIGTAHSGSAEVIIPGVSGFRVGKDDAESMGRYLAELKADRALLEQLSRAAADIVRRFHPDKVLDALESELYRVVADHAPAPRT